MAKIIRYNLSFLGTIELDEYEENLNDSQIKELIAEHFYDMCGGELEYANDIDYDVEEK